VFANQAATPSQKSGKCFPETKANYRRAFFDSIDPTQTLAMA
jgi:hypothetical protein